MAGSGKRVVLLLRGFPGDTDEEECKLFLDNYKEEDDQGVVFEKDCYDTAKKEAKFTVPADKVDKYLEMTWDLIGTKLEIERENMSRTVEVTALPSDINETKLKLIFMSKKKSGGSGPIEEVRIDRKNNLAYIVFKDINDHKNVLDHGHALINDVKHPVNKSGTFSDPVRKKVIVRNDSGGIVDKDVLECMLDSAVTDSEFSITLCKDQKEAEVECPNAEVASFLTEKKMMEYEDYAYTIDTVSSVSKKKEVNRTVHLDGVDNTVTKNVLQLLFGERCEIENIDIFPERQYARITFQEESDAKRTVEKGAHELPSRKKLIASFAREDTAKDDDSCRQVMIEGDLTGYDEHLLKLIFEELGGGLIERVDIHQNKRTAIIEFCDAYVTRELFEITKDEINQTMGIEVRLSSVTKRGKQQPKAANKTIIVKGVKPHQQDEAVLSFQSERATGGGKVKQFTYSNNDLLTITFEEADVAERVHQRREDIKDTHGWIVQTPSEVQDHCSRTLKLAPLQKNHTKKVLELYFEKYGKPEIQIVDGEDERFAEITFKDSETAKKVLEKKSYVIGVYEVKVTELESEEVVDPTSTTSSTSDPQCILISGQKEAIEPGRIKLIVKACKQKNFNLVFGLDPTKVMIEFMNEAIDDMDQLARDIEEKDNNLTVSQLSRTQAIQVFNIEGIDVKNMEWYFIAQQNEAGGQGNQVPDLQVHEDHVIVTFNSVDLRKVISGIKGEKLNDRHLHVCQYHEELGLLPPDHDMSQPPVVLPPSIHPDIPQALSEYLQVNNPGFTSLQTKLTRHHALLKRTQDGKLQVVCNLKRNEKDLENLKKEWLSNIEVEISEWRKQMKNVDVQCSAEMIWYDFKSKVNDCPMQPNVLKMFNENKMKVSITGPADVIPDIANQLAEYDRECRRSVSTLDDSTIEMMNLDDCQVQYVKAVGHTFPYVTVQFRETQIDLEGLSDDVKKARSEIARMVRDIRKRQLRKPIRKIAVADKEPAQNRLNEELKKNNIVGVYWVSKDQLYVVAKTETDFQEMERIFDETIDSIAISVSPEAQSLLHTNEWEGMKTALQEGTAVHIQVDSNDTLIYVATFKDFLQVVKEQVEDFLKDYSMKIEIIPASQGLVQYVMRWEKDALQKLQQQYQDQHAKVEKHNTGFNLQASAHGIHKIKASLLELLKKVKIGSVLFNKPGETEFLDQQLGKPLITNIEQKAEAIIERAETAKAEAIRIAKSKISQIAYSGMCKKGQLCKVWTDDMSKHEADTLAIFVDERMDLSEKFGTDIQKNYLDFLKQQGSLLEGTTGEIKSGNLPVKKLLVLGTEGGDNQEEENIALCIDQALSKASDCQHGVIAIQYVSKLASPYVYVNAVTKHFEDYSSSSVQEVHFLASVGDIEDMKSACEEVLDKSVPAPPILQIGNVSLLCTNGQIENIKVDAIANLVGKQGERSGSSGTVTKAAGESVLRQYKQIQKKDIIISDSGNLGNCKNIYHLQAVPSSVIPNAVIFKKRLDTALNTATANRCSSVALLSAAGEEMGLDGKTIAEVLLSSVISAANKNTALKEVKVVFPREGGELIGTFAAALQSCCDSAAVASSAETTDKEEEQKAGDDVQQHGSSTTVSFETINLVVMQGDFLKEKTNGILNCTNTEMDLTKSEVGQAIHQATAGEIQEECRELRGVMVKDRIVLTGGGKLKAERIVHLDTSIYTSPTDWTKGIIECLDKLELLRVDSVLFPPFPEASYITEEQLAQYVMEGVAKFSKKRPKHMRLIKCVCPTTDVFSIYSTIAKEAISKPKAAGQKKPQIKRESTFETPGFFKAQALSELEVRIYAKTDDKIEQVKQNLSDFCKEHMESSKIGTKQDGKADVIAGLTENEKVELELLAEQYGVSWYIYTSKTQNYINLRGISGTLMRAREAIVNALDEIQKVYEGTKTLTWRFTDNDKFVTRTFSRQNEKALEDAHIQGKANVELEEVILSQTHIFVVDLKAMAMTDKRNASKYKIERVNIMQALPQNWSLMTGQMQTCQETLDPSSGEYRRVASEAKDTMGNEKWKIQKIVRIQQRGEYKQFWDKQNGMAKPNLTWLFHGTNKENTNRINTTGFNRGKDIAGALPLGSGVYFTKTMAAALQTYAQETDDGEKYVYRARVLLGESGEGTPGIKAPPPKPGSTEQYDSVVDDVTSPTTYVIFQDNQAYPEYSIVLVKDSSATSMEEEHLYLEPLPDLPPRKPKPLITQTKPVRGFNLMTGETK